MAGTGYAFLRRPVWIAGAALALVAALVFARLGIWQLDRHDERRRSNAAVAVASAAGPEPFATLLAAVPDGADHRPASATGSYVPASTALLQSRTYRGQSGFHVLTAFATTDGPVIVVDRGWVPLSVVEDPAALAPPPSGTVALEGRARVQRGDAVVNAARGALPHRVSRVDPAALEALWGLDLAEPLYLELAAQDPPAAPSDPRPADPPTIGSGPHLAYAIQWFAFAAIALGGFAVLARRTARLPAPTDRPAEARQRSARAG